MQAENLNSYWCILSHSLSLSTSASCKNLFQCSAMPGPKEGQIPVILCLQSSEVNTVKKPRITRACFTLPTLYHVNAADQLCVPVHYNYNFAKKAESQCGPQTLIPEH